VSTVAVLGTGIMGTGMARSLLRAGHEVRAWNRSVDRAKPLAEDGATVAADPSEAVRGADVVLTMLFDADSVLQVVGAVVDEIGPDAVWLQTSTIGIDGAQRAAAFAAEHGIAALDAPVLGTKAPAEQGTLTVLVSGDPALVDRVRPVLDAIGAKTVVAGDRFGQASALKLACNSFIAVVTAAIGQALELARAIGVRPRLVLEAFEGAAVNSPYLQLKGKQVLAGKHPTSFAVDGVVKDLGLVLAAAREVGIPEGLLRASLAAFQQASDAGHGGEDMAAVATAFRPAG